MRRVKLLLAASLLASSGLWVNAPAANACMGPVCDAINVVCNATVKKDCVG